MIFQKFGKGEHCSLSQPTMATRKATEMYFKLHNNSLVLSLLAVLIMATPQSWAGAPTTTAASEEDVLRAYALASEQSYQRLNATKTPAENALESVKKQADQLENLELQPANEAWNAATVPAFTTAKEARDKAFATEIAANDQARAQYQAALKQAEEAEHVAIDRARFAYAAKQSQFTADLKAVAKQLGPDRGAELQVASDAVKAALTPLAAAANAAVERAVAELGAAKQKADQVYRQAQAHNREVAEAAIQPDEEAYAVAKEQADNARTLVLKKAYAARSAAEEAAKRVYDQVVGPVEAAYNAAEIKRVEIWKQYKAGRISADAAVSELTALANSAGE